MISARVTIGKQHATPSYALTLTLTLTMSLTLTLSLTPTPNPIQVERRGVRCTHVDALRFFAPAAGQLNAHGLGSGSGSELGLGFQAQI